MNRIRAGPYEKTSCTYLVQVPLARGRVIPEMDSIKDDLPALWDPTTAIMGKSISDWTLRERVNQTIVSVEKDTYPVLCIRLMSLSILRLPAL